MKPEPALPWLTRSHIFTIAFFAAFLFLLYQMGLMLAAFSASLLWAGIIVLALHPVYSRLVTLLRGRTGFAAAGMTVLTLLGVIGPAIALLAVLVSESVDVYQWLAEGIKSGELLDLWNRLSSRISRKVLDLPLIADVNIREMVINGLRLISSSLASQVGEVLRDTLVLLFNLIIMLTALFFFFRDGESYYKTAMDLFPFPAEQKDSIARKLHDTFIAVINGVFLIAAVQGLLTGLGFALFGVPFPVFWGFLAAILSLLPFGGAALVWIPGVVYLLLIHATVKGVLLAVWGTFLVSMLDNFMRPVLIGKKARLSTFFLFLGILGGLQIYGFLGILFGPMIVTLLTAFVQIYREEFGGIESKQ